MVPRWSLGPPCPVSVPVPVLAPALVFGIPGARHHYKTNWCAIIAWGLSARFLREGCARLLGVKDVPPILQLIMAGATLHGLPIMPTATVPSFFVFFLFEAESFLFFALFFVESYCGNAAVSLAIFAISGLNVVEGFLWCATAKNNWIRLNAPAKGGRSASRLDDWMAGWPHSTGGTQATMQQQNNHNNCQRPGSKRQPAGGGRRRGSRNGGKKKKINKKLS